MKLLVNLMNTLHLFQSVLNTCNTDNTSITDDLLNIYEFIEDKAPENVRFHIPPITSPQVFEFIRKLDPVKATGLDGVGPRILKLAAEILSPSIAALVNKSLYTGQFPNQLQMAKVFPIFKSTAPFLFYPPYPKYSRNMLINIPLVI